MHINEIPLEIFVKILSYLPTREIFRIECVCRHWQKHVFMSIRCLAFEKFDEVVCGQGKHWVSREDLLPYHVSVDDDMMDSILSKCGEYLHSFKGSASPRTVQTIVEICSRLQCSNMLFDDLKSLKLFVDRFGMQLVCATLYTNLRHGINPFLCSCTNLTSLAILPPVVPRPNRSGKLCPAIVLFDFNAENPSLPQPLTSLKYLVMKSSYVGEETLKRLVMFTNLCSVRISLDQGLYHSSLWDSVIKSWSSLKSLSLKILGSRCLHFEQLPPNLQYLSVKAGGFNTAANCSYIKGMKFINSLPKLRILKIFLMSDFEIDVLLHNLVFYCPSVEQFTFKVSYCPEGLMDENFRPLLSMSSLKQLTLRNHFDISDNFASELASQMNNLTMLGGYSKQTCNSVLPNGPMFWDSIKNKAQSCPSQNFYLIGTIKDRLHLSEPFPSNVHLELSDSAAINLSNGMGKSEDWLAMTKRWSCLRELTLEITDVNFSLSSLPSSLTHLSIKCQSENANKKEDRPTLMFETRLPKLQELQIFQEVMSNEQFGATLQCVVNCCPKIQYLCIRRGNDHHGYVDELLTCLFNCQHLEWLCLSGKILVSDTFAAELINKVQSLNCFGCKFENQLGIDCGPMFLNALAAKAINEDITIICGLSETEIEQMIQPLGLYAVKQTLGWRIGK